jgi:hypothetical protein
VFLAVALDGGFVGGTAINGDGLRHPTMPTDRFCEKLFGGLRIPLLGAEQVNRLALFVDGAVEIFPLAFDPDVSSSRQLIHTARLRR